jgi:hypothetical protein
MRKHLIRALLQAIKTRRRPPPADRVLTLPQIKRTAIDHYLAIAAIVKNEENDLEEWIDFHTMVGCSQFYIYDNNSSDGTPEILNRYARSGLVTPIPWPDFMPWSALVLRCTPQLPAYAHALASFGGRCRWMMFIDADEFVFPAFKESLADALADFEDVPSLALPWHMFGSSGHESRPSGLIIENYTMRASIPPVRKDLGKFKSVVDPTRVRRPGTHRFGLAEGDAIYSQQRRIVRGRYAFPSEDDPIVLNHYYSKSKQEAEAKLRRVFGGVTNPSTTKRARIEAIESASVEDRRIQRFVPRLKEMRNSPQRAAS